jgi:serine/threonine protein kinase
MTDIETSAGSELASRYRVERPLGSGGMGRVFEAVDQQLGRRVAIKLIRGDLDNPVARDRFLHEARAAAAISHPNACQLFEVSEHEGEPFLVLELLDGEPLTDRLARGPLTRDEAVTVVMQLMDVLGAFHAAGLIHRDLKPANVFLTTQGVKLLDFGLARPTPGGDAMTAPALTAPGAVTGTLRYMAPEQVTGDPVDARTDVFALGVILFEMLTGRVPFGEGTNADWLRSVLTQEPPSLNDPGLQSLDPVVMRALQRRPDDRFASIDEMAEALRAALGETAAPAPKQTVAPRSGLPAVVLPFRLLQEDAELAVLQDGIPEMLTALLSVEGRWQMLSNRVAQEFTRETDLLAAGRSLKVGRMLTGSIQRAGNEVRVTVQLISATDGRVEWSETSQHVMTSGVLSLQDEICKRILEDLRAHPPGSDTNSHAAVKSS